VPPPPEAEDYRGEKLLPPEITAIEKALERERRPLEQLPRAVKDIPGGARLAYRRSRYLISTAYSNGQRKLLMGEVDFLNRHGHRADTVVYAGAAPGVHIPFLAELFPRHRFELYDPAPFELQARAAGERRAMRRIRSRQVFFTDEVARRYRGRQVLFISDIRSGRHDMTAARFEDAVDFDMKLQRQWVEIIRPEAAMLKFRLPYSKMAKTDHSEYFAGEARLQPWKGKSSTEMRLHVVKQDGEFPLHQYAHAEYEEKLYYYNLVLRTWIWWDHGLDTGRVPGLDHCADCALEAAMWGDYLQGQGREATAAAIEKLMLRVQRQMHSRLDKPPHGTEPEVPMRAKRERLVRACLEGRAPCFSRDPHKHLASRTRLSARREQAVEALRRRGETVLDPEAAPGNVSSGPRQQNESSESRQQNETSGPRQQNESSGPRQQNESSGPRQQNESSEPRQQNETSGPRQ
jgi:hypothetical protein